MITDPAGYVAILNKPESIEGRSSKDINIQIIVPKDATIPLKGKISIKGYFIIK
jgi:hypothetical protein